MTTDTARSPGFVALLRRHPVVAFVLLAYALSWWAWFWYRADPENVGAPILPIGPLIATALLLPLIGGWAGVKELVGRILLWRVGWRWYGVVLGLPVLLTLSAVGLNLLLGAQVVPDFELPGAANLASTNTVAILWRMFEGGDQLRLWWIWCGLWVIATLIVIAATGPDLRRVRS
jgi:hypothetical protein